METSQPIAGRVMGGWFAAAAVGVVIAVFAQSDAPPAVCMGLCFSDRLAAEIAAVVFALPSLVVGAIVGLFVLRRLARRGRTGVVAGCVAGIVGLVCGPVLVTAAISLYLAVKRL